jgi:hypothetical protein
MTHLTTLRNTQPSSRTDSIATRWPAASATTRTVRMPYRISTFIGGHARAYAAPVAFSFGRHLDRRFLRSGTPSLVAAVVRRGRRARRAAGGCRSHGRIRGAGRPERIESPRHQAGLMPGIAQF